MDKGIKKIPWYLYPTIILILLLASTIGKEIGNEVSKTMGISPSAPATSQTELGETQRKAWVDSCVNEGATNTYCECTFKFIKERMTVAQLMAAMKETSTTGKIDPRFKQAFQNCENQNR